jgi:hypothetical protein
MFNIIVLISFREVYFIQMSFVVGNLFKNFFLNKMRMINLFLRCLRLFKKKKKIGLNIFILFFNFICRRFI